MIIDDSVMKIEIGQMLCQFILSIQKQHIKFMGYYILHTFISSHLNQNINQNKMT